MSDADCPHDFCDIVLDVFNAAGFGVELQMARHGHCVHGVELGTHAEVVSGCVAVLRERDVVYEDFAGVACWSYFTTDKRDCCRLACAIWTKKGETFAFLDAEAHVVHGSVGTEGFADVHHAKSIVG